MVSFISSPVRRGVQSPPLSSESSFYGVDGYPSRPSLGYQHAQSESRLRGACGQARREPKGLPAAAGRRGGEHGPRRVRLRRRQARTHARARRHTHPPRRRPRMCTHTITCLSTAHARTHARTHAHAHARVLAHSGMDASSADMPCPDTPSFTHAHTRTRPHAAKHARTRGGGGQVRVPGGQGRVDLARREVRRGDGERRARCVRGRGRLG